MGQDFLETVYIYLSTCERRLELIVSSMVGTVKTELNKLLIKQCAVVSIHRFDCKTIILFFPRSPVYFYTATRYIALDKTSMACSRACKCISPHNISDLVR